jgi:hypothetical protein
MLCDHLGSIHPSVTVGVRQLRQSPKRVVFLLAVVDHLDDPQCPRGIEGHGHRTLNQWLTGHQLDLKAWLHLNRCPDVIERQWGDAFDFRIADLLECDRVRSQAGPENNR